MLISYFIGGAGNSFHIPCHQKRVLINSYQSLDRLLLGSQHIRVMYYAFHEYNPQKRNRKKRGYG